ncbi:hypothetical protein D3C81_2165710 [compost metagenome]
MLEDLLAQVGGDWRVGIGDVLVLALRAAQLGGQVAETLALGIVGEFVGIDGCLADTAQGQAQGEGGEQALHLPAASSTSPW